MKRNTTKLFLLFLAIVVFLFPAYALKSYTENSFASTEESIVSESLPSAAETAPDDFLTSVDLPVSTPPEVPAATLPAPADESLMELDAPSPEAAAGLAEQVNFFVLVEDIPTTAPTDGNYETVQHFEPEARMRLYPDSPIRSLYLIWDALPGEFSLSVNGKTYLYSADEYLHQYIELPESSTDIMLQTPDRYTNLCDVYAFSEGTPPDWVQRWRSLGDNEKADLLLFPTHADDEYLFFGGIIPLYAAEGKNIQVVYMNRHVDHDWKRNHELLNGLWAGGDDIYPIINPQNDIKFGSYGEAAAYYGVDVFTAFQVEQIRRFRPDVIVGHDFNGEYGHNTHILNARCLANAVEYAADGSIFPESAEKYGVWDTPKYYVHLYPNNVVTLDYDLPLERFDGKTASEISDDAFSYYVSQSIWYSGVFYSGPYDSHLFGLYRSTVGPDSVGNSLFENIEPDS